MLRRLFIAVVIAFSVAVPSLSPALASAGNHAAEQRRDCVVHVTRTGHRYHQAWCRYLRYSDIPMSRSAALRAGFTPCMVCGGSNCEGH